MNDFTPTLNRFVMEEEVSTWMEAVDRLFCGLGEMKKAIFDMELQLSELRCRTKAGDIDMTWDDLAKINEGFDKIYDTLDDISDLTDEDAILDGALGNMEDGTNDDGGGF